MLYYVIIISLVVITKNVRGNKEIDSSEEAIKESIESTEARLNLYETTVNASIELDKSDKSLLNSWTEQFQMTLVNMTTTYRIQMMRHKDYNFGNNFNPKWRNCTRIYRRNIKRTERDYYGKESECLKTAMATSDEKRLAIAQMEKEIRKWRRSYRYLTNLCNRDNPDNRDGAAVCLVDYMERDNYSEVLKRLLALKLEAMSELQTLLTDLAVDLENCLNSCLSEYLSDVRSVMVLLNRCYSGDKYVEHK